MTGVRAPAVAGSFYPAAKPELRETVERLLAEADGSGPAPKAIIAPHAGYLYSGPVAAGAYARLRAVRNRITRVVLIGPAHRFAFSGVAAAGVAAFRTPLGDVPVDQAAVASLRTLPQVRVLDRAHDNEHCLEVHLPFLQVVLDHFALVPLVVGEATVEEVAEVIGALWGGAETLIVVSSDLSHYYDDGTARRLDAATARAIEALEPRDIGEEQACGRIPVGGLLIAAKVRGLRARTVDLRNSGDTAGTRDEVVGYGAFLFD